MSGGGGNRTPVLGDVNTNGGNGLCKCPIGLAALWLHSPDTDGHEVARIGRIIKAWPSLPNRIKVAVEALFIETSHQD